jgi:hypothetical protein
MMLPSRHRTRTSVAGRAAPDDELVILVMGSGDTAGELPDPGLTGFAIEPRYPGSITVIEEDGCLWFDGEASAIRGTPPPFARGHIRVLPRDAKGWIVDAFRMCTPMRRAH